VSESDSPRVTGTPDRPNFKRHPLMLVIVLLAYASFMAAMIVWAVRLRHSH
jgi:hypothetical protein